MFPPLQPPPSRPNSDPRCNTASNDIADPVTSKLQPNAWRFFLQDYPDPPFVASILQIIRIGANIGFAGPQHAQGCTNLRSAFEHADFTTQAVNKHVTNLTARGPFTDPPFTNFRASPLGCAVRKHSGKLRLINHLSWPRCHSVNDGIPDAQATIRYDAFSAAMDDLRKSGRGSLMSKLDLESAFHHIPIRRADWPLVGWHWDDAFYHAVCLIFGLRSAPYIFNLFAEGLHWIIARHIPASIRHYLDDFWSCFPPGTSTAVARASVEWTISLGRTLGLTFSPDKTIWPSTRIEFLGLELDSVAMHARVPDDKLTFAKRELAIWLSIERCGTKELEALIGFLQFLSQVIPYARAFLRRLHDFRRSFSVPTARRKIPASARADLRWWSTYVDFWNGIHLVDPPRVSHTVYTDASGTKGLGGLFGLQWFATRCPRRMRSQHIQVKEMYAVLQAVYRWGESWRDSHVVFNIDNEAVYWALRNHTSASTVLPHAPIGAADPPPPDPSVVPRAFAEANAGLSARVIEVLWFSRAASTRQTYSTGQRAFLEFLELFPHLRGPEGRPFPASRKCAAEFVVWLADTRKIKVSTVKQYIAHVRAFCVDCAAPLAGFDDEVLPRLIVGLKRIHGDPNPSHVLPITIDILHSIIAKLDLHDPYDLMIRAALTLGFSMFLRCGEFTVRDAADFDPTHCLTRASLVFQPDLDNASRLLVTLPASKTDPFRRGVTVALPLLERSASCPVTAMREYIEQVDGWDNDPLFFNTAPSAPSEPLLRTTYLAQLRRLLSLAGHDADKYSGHSLRRGAATTAASAGLSATVIQRLGRWRSDAYKFYVDTPHAALMSNILRIHMADPPSSAPDPAGLRLPWLA